MAGKRIDSNQNEVVRTLRDLGCHVAITSMVGKGFPDIVVSHLGVTVLVEIKDGKKPPSERKLTKDEEKFKGAYQGWYQIVESADDCQKLFNAIRKKAGYLYG